MSDWTDAISIESPAEVLGKKIDAAVKDLSLHRKFVTPDIELTFSTTLTRRGRDYRVTIVDPAQKVDA